MLVPRGGREEDGEGNEIRRGEIEEVDKRRRRKTEQRGKDRRENRRKGRKGELVRGKHRRREIEKDGGQKKGGIEEDGE